MESLLTNFIEIVEDEKKLVDYIDTVGLSGALLHENNRKGMLLNYIFKSQHLYSSIAENWNEGLISNRMLYQRAMKAVVERRTDCNATSTVIQNLRPLQEKILCNELKERINMLHEIMDVIKSTVSISCFVLRIKDDDLSACPSLHSNYKTRPST